MGSVPEAAGGNMSDSGHTLSDPPWTWPAERKALDEARRRIAVLEAALRPFGALAGFLSEHWSDHAGLAVNGSETDFGRGRARMLDVLG
jgi:hypothetical protein